jgi:hypothetical protein
VPKFARTGGGTMPRKLVAWSSTACEDVVSPLP